MIFSDIGATSQKESVFIPDAYFKGAHGEYVNLRTMEIGGAIKCIITGGIHEISLPANRVVVDINTVYDVEIESSVPAVNLGTDRIYVYCDASAAVQAPNQSDEVQRELGEFVDNTIDSIFAAADDQAFEDGMESTFSRKLVSVIEKYGDLAMSEVNYLITYGKVNSEVVSEALRWLARVKEPTTYAWRLWLLEKSLDSVSPLIRDSAALGLITMGDSHAIPYLKAAIERETISELRHDLTRLLSRLEASVDALSIKDNKEA